jgi:cytoskeleton protein RodZ
LSTLGETLRERRQALGITIDQAAQSTRIRGRLLEAIEDGRFVDLPNPGYVRGYISSYARLLDLEPGPLLSMYRAESGADKYSELNLPALDEAVRPHYQQHAVPWRAAATIALALTLVSLAVWGVTRLVKGPQTPPPVPASSTSTTPVPGSDQASSTTPPTGSGVSAGQAPRAAQNLTPFTLKVVVAANGASWVKVVVDGSPAYEGSLTGGQSKTFEVSREAVVKIGKPSVVTVSRDGKTIAIPASGGIPSLTLKAQPAQ